MVKKKCTYSEIFIHYHGDNRYRDFEKFHQFILILYQMVSINNRNNLVKDKDKSKANLWITSKIDEPWEKIFFEIKITIVPCKLKREPFS